MGSPHTAMKTQCSQKIIMIHSPESCWEDCNYLHSLLLAPRSCYLWGRIRIAKMVPQTGHQVVPPNRDCFCVVQSLSRVQLFVTSWTAECQASLSFILSQSLFKLMSIESVMLSNHLIFCHPLLLSSVFPSISVFSNELALASFLSSPHSSPHRHSHSCSFLPMPVLLLLLRFWNVFLD